MLSLTGMFGSAFEMISIRPIHMEMHFNMENPSLYSSIIPPMTILQIVPFSDDILHDIVLL